MGWHHPSPRLANATSAVAFKLGHFHAFHPFSCILLHGPGWQGGIWVVDAQGGGGRHTLSTPSRIGLQLSTLPSTHCPQGGPATTLSITSRSLCCHLVKKTSLSPMPGASLALGVPQKPPLVPLLPQPGLHPQPGVVPPPRHGQGDTVLSTHQHPGGAGPRSMPPVLPYGARHWEPRSPRSTSAVPTENKAMPPIPKPTRGRGCPHIIHILRTWPAKGHRDSPDSGVPHFGAHSPALPQGCWQQTGAC